MIGLVKQEGDQSSNRKGRGQSLLVPSCCPSLDTATVCLLVLQARWLHGDIVHLAYLLDGRRVGLSLLERKPCLFYVPRPHWSDSPDLAGWECVSSQCSLGVCVFRCTGVCRCVWKPGHNLGRHSSGTVRLCCRHSCFQWLAWASPHGLDWLPSEPRDTYVYLQAQRIQLHTITRASR